jgi:hypothetical protein
MDDAGLYSKWVSRNKDEDKKSRYFRSHTVDCYTRERVKKEEKEILQHQTSFLYTQVVPYPRIILHASMYQPNNCSMILHTGKLFLSGQPRHNIRRRSTSFYILISFISFLIISTLSHPSRAFVPAFSN